MSRATAVVAPPRLKFTLMVMVMLVNMRRGFGFLVPVATSSVMPSGRPRLVRTAVASLGVVHYGKRVV